MEDEYKSGQPFIVSIEGGKRLLLVKPSNQAEVVEDNPTNPFSRSGNILKGSLKSW